MKALVRPVSRRYSLFPGLEAFRGVVDELCFISRVNGPGGRMGPCHFLESFGKPKGKCSQRSPFVELRYKLNRITASV